MKFGNIGGASFEMGPEGGVAPVGRGVLGFAPVGVGRLDVFPRTMDVFPATTDVGLGG